MRSPRGARSGRERCGSAYDVTVEQLRAEAAGERLARARAADRHPPVKGSSRLRSSDFAVRWPQNLALAAAG